MFGLYRESHVLEAGCDISQIATTGSTSTTPRSQNFSFDLVAAFEVFMHRDQREVEAYVHETTRVLRPAGRARVSFVAVTTTPIRGATPPRVRPCRQRCELVHSGP